MSILIKSMKMPRDCPMCPFAHYVNGYGPFTGCNFVSGKKYAMTEDKEYAESSERPSWCPLIELSPHGDLIDRDSVLEILSDKNAAWDGYVKVKALPTIIESEGEDGNI